MEQSHKTGIDRRGFLRAGGLLAAGIGATPLIAGCKGSTGSDSNGLTIWWNQGYYPEEDQAAKDIVTKWEKKTGKKADLQLYGTTDIVTKEQSAVAAGEPPDIIYAQKGFTPTYAFQGKLEDVSEVINSTQLTDGAKRAAHLYNQKEDKVSYYSIPLHQFTVSMFYWRSLITQAGMDDKNLPTDWDGYWKFWKNVQDASRDKGKKGIYAVGWPMGTAAGDTNYDTQQILRSFDVELLDEKSQLKADDPAVRKGIANAMEFLGGLFNDGYTPKACINWQDDGNNTSFLSKTLVSTPNGSLSIPGALKDENDKDWKDMVTAVWPERAAGGPMPSLSLTHNAIVFKDSKKKKLAKDFLTFMMQPENIGSVLEGGKGRWFPVNEPLLTQPFWAKSTDPNIKVVANQLAGDTAANWADLSPAYQKVETTHVWGKTIGQIALQGKSPDDAADYALTQMKQIFEQFKH